MNQQNVQRLRELMAANGLTASGENVTAQVAQNNTRQASLNALNVQEQQVMNDFDRRIADIQDPSQANAITSQIEAQRAQAMFDAYNRVQGEAYQRERDGVLDERYDTEFARRNAEWESEQKWNRSVWQKEFARRNAEWESSQKADRAWREYTFNNMSASEKAQLEWAKAQYGEEAAWRMYEMEYGGELQKSMAESERAFYENLGMGNFLP